MFLDFRKLKKKTIGGLYPLPNLNHILDSLGSAEYFSVLENGPKRLSRNHIS